MRESNPLLILAQLADVRVLEKATFYCLRTSHEVRPTAGLMNQRCCLKTRKTWQMNRLTTRHLWNDVFLARTCTTIWSFRIYKHGPTTWRSANSLFLRACGSPKRIKKIGTTHRFYILRTRCNVQRQPKCVWKTLCSVIKTKDPWQSLYKLAPKQVPLRETKAFRLLCSEEKSGTCEQQSPSSHAGAVKDLFDAFNKPFFYSTLYYCFCKFYMIELVGSTLKNCLRHE